jgi:hypothetical protein
MAADHNDSFAAFERNLQDWLVRAVEPPAEPAPRSNEPILLRMFEERLKHLQTHLDQAEHDAEQALAPLGKDIAALEQWLQQLNLARARVVECTARGA